MPYPYQDDTRDAYRKYLQEDEYGYDPIGGYPMSSQPPADEMSSTAGVMPWEVPPSWASAVPTMPPMGGGMPMGGGAPMYQGGIDPNIAGTPYGPRMYYGEPMYDLDQQGDAALQQNRLLGQMVDPAQFIMIPGSYDPYSPSMIGEQTINVPGTPMLDFYGQADSVEGDLARKIAEGVAPQEYVRQWAAQQRQASQADLIAQGYEGTDLQMALDRENERIGYESNDLAELGMSFITEQSENQAAQSALQSHPMGGYEGGAYERFGVTPPWERYPLETFNPEMTNYAEDYARRLGEMGPLENKVTQAKEQIVTDQRDKIAQAATQEQEWANVLASLAPKVPEPPTEEQFTTEPTQVPIAGSQWQQTSPGGFDQGGYQQAMSDYGQQWGDTVSGGATYHPYTPATPVQGSQVQGPFAPQGYTRTPEFQAFDQARDEAQMVRTAGFLAEAQAAAQRDFYEAQGHTPMMDQLAARRQYINYLYSPPPFGG